MMLDHTKEERDKITIQELADALGITHGQCDYRHRTGHYEAIKVGGRLSRTLALPWAIEQRRTARKARR